jgi:hypothetical protein
LIGIAYRGQEHLTTEGDFDSNPNRTSQKTPISISDA